MFGTALRILVLATGMIVAGVAQAGSVEAKKNGVKIYVEASKKSRVVSKLKKGDQVESLERKGMYWQVKTKDGKPGFVSVFKVKRAKSETSNLSKAIRKATKAGRSVDDVAGARSRSAVMGVRGLGEDDDTAFAGEARPNLRAVYAMEDYVPSEAAIESQGDLVFAEIEKYAE